MSGTKKEFDEDDFDAEFDPDHLDGEQIRQMMNDGAPAPEENVQRALVDPNAPLAIGERMAEISQVEALKSNPEALDPDEELRRALLAEFDEFAGDIADADEDMDEDGEPKFREERVKPEIRDIYTPPTIARNDRMIAGAADRGHNALVAAAQPQVEPRWRSMRSLPMGDEVLNLGRSIFRSAPCFRAMEEMCREQRRDPFGEIKVILHAEGAGFGNSREEVDGMSRWIMQNGRIIDHDQIEFPGIFQRMNYRPNVILATSDEDSFMLVQDTIRNGAPGNATYIYSWRGGRNFYDNVAGIQQLSDNFGGRFARRLHTGQATLAAPAAPARLAAPNIIDMDPDDISFDGDDDKVKKPAGDISFDDDEQSDFEKYMEEQRKIAAPNHPEKAPVENTEKAEKVKQAAPVPTPAPAPKPATPSRVANQQVNMEKAEDDILSTIKAPEKVVPKSNTRINLVQAMRGIGFDLAGSDYGPILKKGLDDGTTMYISSAQSRGLAISTLFNIEVMDETNNVLDEKRELSAEQVVDEAKNYSPAQGLRL